MMQLGGKKLKQLVGGWSEKTGFALDQCLEIKLGRWEALPRQWAWNLSVMARVEGTSPPLAW